MPPEPERSAAPLTTAATAPGERAPLSRAIAYVLATWFGCGRMPRAPGTTGTLGAIPLYLLVRPYGHVAVGVTALVITAVGLWAASVVVAHENAKDPQHIVIDEVAGVLVTLTVAPPTWQALLVGVVAFRVFDQLKPWPARALERGLKGAPGVVFDDVAAGVWGAAVVFLLERIGVLA